MEYERCTLDDVASALSHIPADDRETWYKMGMAIKSEFGGDGYDAWDQWSQGADSYNAGAARSSWKSFKVGGGITIATLFKEAIDRGWASRQSELSEERKAELDRERAARQEKRLREEAEEAELTERWYQVIAAASRDIWALLAEGGKSPYLGKKKIRPFGARFVPRGIVVVFGEEASPGVRLVTGRDAINDFFRAHKKAEVKPSIRYLKPGCLVVPLSNIEGELQNLQIIYASGEKSFLKHGPKSRTSFLIGTISPGSPIVFVEGFATGASVHMATGYPVVVCWDAGNLPVVARLYRAFYSPAEHPFVIAGDNDTGTEGNPGLQKAREAANDVGGRAVVPVFEVANG